MPLKLICASCSKTIHNSAEFMPPSQILTELDGKCPKCGCQLTSSPISVNINGEPMKTAENNPKPRRQKKW